MEHWPRMAKPAQGPLDRQALESILNMLVVVKSVLTSIHSMRTAGCWKVIDTFRPGMVRQPLVDIEAVRAFLTGAELPLLASDPKSPGARKIFPPPCFHLFPAAPRLRDTFTWCSTARRAREWREIWMCGACGGAPCGSRWRGWH